MFSKFLGVSLERLWSVLGGLLGWFWRSGMLLGSVVGGQNVDISLGLHGFLECVFLLMFCSCFSILCFLLFMFLIVIFD